jgi:hypothetical protein
VILLNFSVRKLCGAHGTTYLWPPQPLPPLGFSPASSAAVAFSAIALAHSSSVIFSVQTSFLVAAAFSPLHPLVPELAALSAPTVPSDLPPQPLAACSWEGTIAPTAVTSVAMPRLARTFFSSLPSIAFSFV